MIYHKYTTLYSQELQTLLPEPVYPIDPSVIPYYPKGKYLFIAFLNFGEDEGYSLHNLRTQIILKSFESSQKFRLTADKNGILKTEPIVIDTAETLILKDASQKYWEIKVNDMGILSAHSLLPPQQSDFLILIDAINNTWKIKNDQGIIVLEKYDIILKIFINEEFKTFSTLVPSPIFKSVFIYAILEDLPYGKFTLEVKNYDETITYYRE